MWVNQRDEYGRSFRVNTITGERVYDMVGVSPVVSPQLHPISAPQQGLMPPVMNYVYGGNPPRQPYQVQSLAGTLPPLLNISSPTWEEHYDISGHKYWVHTVTRQINTVDPYV